MNSGFGGLNTGFGGVQLNQNKTGLSTGGFGGMKSDDPFAELLE